MSEPSRRDITKGLAAILALAATGAPAIAKPLPQTHPLHEFLTRVGVDSNTAPIDLTLNFKDSNRSILHVTREWCNKFF